MSRTMEQRVRISAGINEIKLRAKSFEKSAAIETIFADKFLKDNNLTEKIILTSMEKHFMDWILMIENLSNEEIIEAVRLSGRNNPIFKTKYFKQEDENEQDKIRGSKDKPVGIVSNDFLCPVESCRGTKANFFITTTRSADESQTIIIECLSCRRVTVKN